MKHLKPYENFLDENAISADDVAGRNSIGLVRYDSPVGIKETALILYDFDDKKVLGFSEIGRFPDEPIEITRTAAEKGYGPMMYDFILMTMYPVGILPDRDSISEPALNIWKFYYKNRSDVKKDTLKPGSPGYVKNYSVPHQEERSQKDPEKLKVLNTTYYMAPSDQYKNLLHRGEELLAKNKMRKNGIYRAASDFFDSKYKLQRA